MFHPYVCKNELCGKVIPREWLVTEWHRTAESRIIIVKCPHCERRHEFRAEVVPIFHHHSIAAELGKEFREKLDREIWAPVTDDALMDPDNQPPLARVPYKAPGTGWVDPPVMPHPDIPLTHAKVSRGMLEAEGQIEGRRRREMEAAGRDMRDQLEAAARDTVITPDEMAEVVDLKRNRDLSAENLQLGLDALEFEQSKMGKGVRLTGQLMAIWPEHIIRNIRNRAEDLLRRPIWSPNPGWAVRYLDTLGITAEQFHRANTPRWRLWIEDASRVFGAIGNATWELWWAFWGYVRGRWDAARSWWPVISIVAVAFFWTCVDFTPAMAEDTVTWKYHWTAPTTGSPAVRYAVETRIDDGDWRAAATVDADSVFVVYPAGATVELRVAGIDEFDRRGTWSNSSAAEFTGYGTMPAPGAPVIHVFRTGRWSP